jgi:hypothetical protein
VRACVLPALQIISVVVMIAAASAAIASASAGDGDGDGRVSHAQTGGGLSQFGNVTENSSSGPHFSAFGNYVADHLPLYLGRTHVGMHAGDVLRAVQFLASRPDTGRGSGGSVVLVAENNLVSAALHALVGGASDLAAGSAADAFVSGLASVQCIASYMSVASSRYYAMPHWMEMANVLPYYGTLLFSAASLRLSTQLRIACRNRAVSCARRHDGSCGGARAAAGARGGTHRREPSAVDERRRRRRVRVPTRGVQSRDVCCAHGAAGTRGCTGSCASACSVGVIAMN